MGSNNAGKEGTGRELIFSTSGYALGLASGRLFGCPPVPGPSPLGTTSGADVPDVPDEQGTRPLDKDNCHDA